MGVAFQIRLCPGRTAAQFTLHMRPGQLVGVQVGRIGGNTHNSSRPAGAVTHRCSRLAVRVGWPSTMRTILRVMPWSSRRKNSQKTAAVPGV